MLSYVSSIQYLLTGDSRICSLARVITPWSCQLGRSWSVRGSAPVAILFIISMLTLQCRLLFNRVGPCFLGVGLVDRVCVYGALVKTGVFGAVGVCCVFGFMQFRPHLIGLECVG